MQTYYDFISNSMNTTTYLISVVFYVLYVIAMWKIFKKADEPGWTSIIPILNVYKLYKISMGNGWLALLLLIPVVNVVIYIIMNIKLAKAFGKGGGFALGLILLNTIFVLILGFGKDQYIGPNGERKF